MSTATQSVYVRDDFSEPMSAQHNFANQYDLDNPSESMSVYARIMHDHTKHQLDMATNSARRRTQNGNQASLSPESSRGSVSSTDS